MPLTRRAMIGLAPLAVALLVAGCSNSVTNRLKLTFQVEVDGEIKTASTVLEFRRYDVIFPERAARTATTGEALYLDLGVGRKPLVAILNRHKGLDYGPWGTYGAMVAYGIVTRQESDAAPALHRKLRGMRGEREYPFDLIPPLVTFANPLDPTTVEAVDPNDLEASLGSGVKWHRVTIEVTDEDITEGVIEERLPWLKAMDGARRLDGQRSRDMSSFANTLARSDFMKAGF